MDIWEPKPPGTLWATLGLLQDSFKFFNLKGVLKFPYCMTSQMTGHTKPPDHGSDNVLFGQGNEHLSTW